MILHSDQLLGEYWRSRAKQDRARKQRELDDIRDLQPPVPEHYDEDALYKIAKELKPSQQSKHYTLEILQSIARHTGYPPGVTCSKAYVNFKIFLDDLRGKYAHLNPVSEFSKVAGEGCILGPVDGDLHPAVKEFFRAGVIRTMVAWEAFIGDIMAETFDIVADELWNDQKPELDLRFAYILSFTTTSDSHSTLSKWFLHKVLDKQKVKYEKDYKAQAKDHKEKYLRNIYPLLSLPTEKCPKQGGCVDKTFLQMFYPEPHELLCRKQFQLSLLIPGNNFKYPYTLVNDRGLDSKVTIWIKERTLLRHMTRLYYGLRNVFSHGCSGRTLTTGALSCFPNAEEFYSMMSDSVFLTILKQECNDRTKSLHYAKLVSGELYRLYEEMCEDARTVHVSYLTLVNLNRFILQLAHFLPRAIQYMIHRDFKVALWDFDPDRFERHLT